MSDTQSVPLVRKYPVTAAAPWIIVIGLVLALVVAPPFAGIPFLHTKTMLLALTALLALIFFVVSSLARGAVVVPPVTLLATLWLVPLAYALSTLFSGNPPAQSFFGVGFETDTFGFVLMLTVLATLAALVLRSGAQYRLLLRGAGIALALVLLAEVVFIPFGRLMGVNPTFNLIGSFVDVAAVAGLYLVVAMLALRSFELAKRLRLLVLAGVVVALGVLAVVNATVTWLIVGTIALGFFVEAMMRRRAASDTSDPEALFADDEPRGAPLVAPLAVLIVSVFFAVGGSTVSPLIANVFGTSFIDARPSWQSTFMVGSHTYASSPLFGSGPGSFKNEWAKHHDRSVNDDNLFWNADFAAGVGYIPTSFITTGVLGALAWIVFLGSFLLLGARTLLFRLPSGRLERFVTLGSFLAAFCVLATAFFAVPGPVVLAVGFIAVGVFISALRSAEGSYEWGIVFSKAPRLGFVVVFALTILLLASVAATYVVVERYLADVSNSRAAVALARGDIDTAEREIGRSLTLAETDRTYRLAATVAVARIQQIVTDRSLTPTIAQQRFRTAVSDAIVASTRATERNPRDYQNWTTLGAVYGSLVPLQIEGAYEQAAAAYEEARLRAPLKPSLPFTLAQLELARGNRAGAEEHLVEAIGLKRNYVAAILILSRIKVENGETREALEAAEAAAFLAPNDASVLFQVGLLRFAAGNSAGAVEALESAVAINPGFANAHFYLAVTHAVSGRYEEALAELQTVGELSEENIPLIAADVAALEEGRNPFPTSRLEALGIPYVPVAEPGS